MTDVKQANLLVISNWDPVLLTDNEKYHIERNGTNKPELRQKLINERLSEYYTIVKPQMKLTPKHLIDLNICSAHFLAFLANCYENWQETPDDQYIHPIMQGLIPLNFSMKRDIQFYHKVISKLPYYKQIGYFAEDTMSPIYANTYDVAMQSANNCYVVADYIKEYDVIYLSNTYPGHHASQSVYGGYCLINNASVTCTRLQEFGLTSCILDIDYHSHSNGTQRIFEQSQDILTISIHADPVADYPSFSGFKDEIGDYGMNKNIIFPKQAKWAEYKRCLDRALFLIGEFNPDVIIIAFGGDTYTNDPDASKNYGCCLELEDYIEIGREIKKLKKKCIVTSEGGYSIEQMPTITHNLLKGLSQ